MLSNKPCIYRIKLAAAVLLTLAAGCGVGDKGHSAKQAPLEDAPTEIAELYKARCINCHGSELQGRVGVHTNLQQVGSRMSAEEITMQIQYGKGVMPGFASTLTQDEIQGLAEWLAGKQ